MFNVAIGGARRVAAQSWPIKRIVAIKDAAGVTVNDVILAMCAGALRAYLIEHDALPDQPLIAMVPVNLRSENDHSSGGNQVGSILCSLATDLSDPENAWLPIHASISGNKEVFSAVAQAAAAGPVGVQRRAAGADPAAGAGGRGPAAVQHRDLQRARLPRAAVLARSPARRQLPAVDRAGRPGAQHHAVQQRRQPRLRAGRLPAQHPAPAAAARSTWRTR